MWTLPALAASAVLAICSASPADVLDHLAALKSAEIILGTIDDLPLTADRASPLSIATNRLATSSKSTHYNARSENAIVTKLDVSGPDISMFIKRRMQNDKHNLVLSSANRDFSQYAPPIEYPQSLYVDPVIQPAVQLPGLAQNPPAQPKAPMYPIQPQDIRLFGIRKHNLHTRTNEGTVLDHTTAPQPMYSIQPQDIRLSGIRKHNLHTRTNEGTVLDHTTAPRPMYSIQPQDIRLSGIRKHNLHTRTNEGTVLDHTTAPQPMYSIQPQDIRLSGIRKHNLHTRTNEGTVLDHTTAPQPMYSIQPQDIRLSGIRKHNLHTRTNEGTVLDHTTAPQPSFNYNQITTKEPAFDPRQSVSIQIISPPYPEWALHAVERLERQSRKPLKSSTLSPEILQLLYSHSSLPVEKLLPEREILETNAKMKATRHWQQRSSSYPISYTLPPIKPPRRSPRTPVTPVIPYMLANIQSMSFQPSANVQPHIKVRLPATPGPNAYAHLRAKLLAINDPNVRLNVNVEHPFADIRSIVNPAPLINVQPVARVRLPEESVTPPPLKTEKKKNSVEKINRLKEFMRQNRDTLLQFIAHKRMQLLANRTAMTTQRQNFSTKIERLNWVVQPVPVWSGGGRGNAGGGRQQAAGGIGSGKSTQGLEPRHLLPPVSDLGLALDLAPAGGARIKQLRNNNRLCHRNVMHLSGPRYDSSARVKAREFRPGIDGVAFRVTKRKRLLLPVCCNCCRNSVLGCE